MPGTNRSPVRYIFDFVLITVMFGYALTVVQYTRYACLRQLMLESSFSYAALIAVP